ncbi:MAG TPA: SpoIIE family protein phosphatase [Candidatus Baltobacteraceae bacterium]|jgi:sigma-B regulation protein RsbU (phosphoserine phosphatase)|nr:SpoIIE family protein phosphatase [Candidatus Baltobacteraceae bacterium]
MARVTGTLLLTAFLLIALAFAVLGAFQTRESMARTFARQSQIQAAQTELEELLRLQIDEENSLRGYSLTHDSFYVEQYTAAAGEFDSRERQLRQTLSSQGLITAQRLVDQYAGLQARWRAAVAKPVLAHPTQQLAEIDKRNKFFSDQEAGVVRTIRAELAGQNDVLGRSTQAELDRSSYVRAFWLLLFGLLAILFNAFRSRLYRELEEERTTTEILQRAFRSEAIPIPHCEVGGAYVSASSHLAVGGDVYDVYRLSSNLALLLIADVSGKGVDAAVLTAFIKFTIRAIALRRRDPAAILSEFNTSFSQAVENPYLFVSMWLGILDTETFVLRYASAGHDSAFIRRSKNVQQLPVTGPILGVMEEPFETRQTNMQAGDLLVLTTDGLTEARTRSGRQLLDAGAMDLIAKGSEHAQELADGLVTSVRALSRNRLRDDLAILVVRPLRGAAPDA